MGDETKADPKTGGVSNPGVSYSEEISGISLVDKPEEEKPEKEEE